MGRPVSFCAIVEYVDENGENLVLPSSSGKMETKYAEGVRKNLPNSKVKNNS